MEYLRYQSFMKFKLLRNGIDDLKKKASEEEKRNLVKTQNLLFESLSVTFYLTA